MEEKLVFETSNNDENYWLELEEEHKCRKVFKGNSKTSLIEDRDIAFKKYVDKIFNSDVKIRVGEIVQGKIIEITKKEIIVNINYKDNVYIDIKSTDQRILDVLEKDSVIEVLLTDIVETPYQIKGSLTELYKMKSKEFMMECYEEQHPIEGIVKEIIPAGYILDLDLGFSTVSGFMPNTLGGVNRLHNPEALLNQRVNVMIENMNYDSGYFVVSRKKYLQSLIPEAIEKLTIGDKCEGWITGLSSYGAYVEFNECLTGLVHKMNMDEETIDKFNNRELKPGDVIDFYVTDICKGERIILAQHLRESLWNTIKDGDVFDGRVKLIKQFGALVELDFETVGLIAQNYMYKNNIRLVEGQEIKVSIVTINKDERKIFLKPII